MSTILKQLVHDFQFLPGVGEKTAQRFAHHIFSKDRTKAYDFVQTLTQALDQVKYCKTCRNLSENDQCDICTSPSRDKSTICIVESPSNIDIIEQSKAYNGLYFVLHGVLSPIEGITAEKIGIPMLAEIISQYEIHEMIIATSTRIEGEATAYYLADQFSDRIKVTRPAHGLPSGGLLDYIDPQTMARALSGRKFIDDAS
ncbi:recombination mediator RecR [Candidatus Comchoanobacter bicostacola]|uniref:Recombination protein RecR n=1 Tax=Candidatus Comchoanobacter bicostacola TaxID=2919598 RepID=A0ABY5DM21_9GAMM|nr:recombination mediator RecR [Candidatus Comchoanobacter bicostacola]UTC24819.1 recombination mediator RecR [Candidatus Comchoanobacter bicostacola]